MKTKGICVSQIGKPTRSFWVTDPKRIKFWRKMAEIGSYSGVCYTQILHDRTGGAV